MERLAPLEGRYVELGATYRRSPDNPALDRLEGVEDALVRPNPPPPYWFEVDAGRQASGPEPDAGAREVGGAEDGASPLHGPP